MSGTNWTEEDLRLAQEALATGAKRVKYKNREVEYQDPDELRQTIREIKACLNGRGRTTRLYSRHSKGFC